MVVFSLRDLNADLLGQVAGVAAGSSAAARAHSAKFRFRRPSGSSSRSRSDASSMDKDDENADKVASSNGTDEENIGPASSSSSSSSSSGGGGGNNATGKKKKASRNSPTYRPAAGGRRSNNLRPHPTKYRPPFLQNFQFGGGGYGSSSSSGGGAHVSPAGSASTCTRTNSTDSPLAMIRQHHHHASSTTKRAPPPIKTAIRFEEDDAASVQHRRSGSVAAAAAAAATRSSAAASAAAATTCTSTRGMTMSSPPPSSRGRGGTGRYRAQRTPHSTVRSNDQHPDVHDANVYGAITFASTPGEEEQDGHDDDGGGGGDDDKKKKFNGGHGSRKARFTANAMGGGSRGRGRGTGAGIRSTGRKQQYRKTPHWKQKAPTSTDASKVNATNAAGDRYPDDNDFEAGLLADRNSIATGNNDNDNNGDQWHSPFSSPAPASQYNFTSEYEGYHNPPQAPPTDGRKDEAATMPNASPLVCIHSARAEVASFTSPNVWALDAMAKPWDSGSFKSPSSSAAASASVTPLSAGNTSYGSRTNDFQILSPNSDLTSNATKTPSTGGTRSSKGSGSGANSRSSFVSARSSFVSATTEQLASWASDTSPTSSSIAKVLDKSLLSPGSTLSRSVPPAGDSTCAEVLSSPGNADAIIVQSTGGSIGIGNGLLVGSSMVAAVNSLLWGGKSPADVASPTAVDKTDAAICFGSYGSAQGVLSPTTTTNTTIASEDAFTPSLRADENGQDTITASTPSVPRMVEARTQTDVTGHDFVKESSSSMANLSSMKMTGTPRSQGHAQKTAMSATAAVFTPSSSKTNNAPTARALSSTASSIGLRQYGHFYAPAASSTPAPIVSATTQLAYIPTEINGEIHYVPTHVVLPAASPYSYTQHYPIQAMAGSVDASFAAESTATARAHHRKPCRITSPAANSARAKKSTTTMNALAREFEPSPKKDDN